MTDTVRDIIANMQQQIDHFGGFIPNGARIYYGGRSQPPLFTQIVWLYYNATGDLDLVRQALPYLDREYAWWMSKRIIPSADARFAGLNRFSSDPIDHATYGPRPESYAEDLVTAAGSAARYQHLQAGAESGWDFSSRWFVPATGTLLDIATADLVPVDLNAILYRNERTLAALHGLAGSPQATVQQYQDAAAKRAAQIKALLWHPDSGRWHDYNWAADRPMVGSLFPSSFAPLWCGLGVDQQYTRQQWDAAVPQSFRESAGGVPTSLPDVQSGQQWDWPNVWAPLQTVMLEAARSVGDDDFALTLAQRWVDTTYCGWNCTGAVFEKYSANEVGSAGRGGEYEVVRDGFGWTNGLVLRAMADYPDRLKAPTKCAC
eukprot:GAFH01001774.1.p1 GENE.GAFH01001774.1~~GAFH01001774.1.p1  ORF type:complete len:375 (-),score=123.60 GAFH01001774.1:163-1287(-)